MSEGTPDGIKGRVLIIDDDASERELIGTFIQKLEPALEIVTASNGPTALQKLTEQNIDLILLDYRLPVVNGLQVLAHLKRNYNIPTVMISGLGSPQVAKEALELGAVDFVIKSVGYHQEVAHRVETWIKHHASRAHHSLDHASMMPDPNPHRELETATRPVIPDRSRVAPPTSFIPAQIPSVDQVPWEDEPREQYLNGPTDESGGHRGNVTATPALIISEIHDKLERFSRLLEQVLERATNEMEPLDESLKLSHRLVEQVRRLEGAAHTPVCRNCVNRFSPLPVQTETNLESSRRGLEFVRKDLSSVKRMLKELNPDPATSGSASMSQGLEMVD